MDATSGFFIDRSIKLDQTLAESPIIFQTKNNNNNIKYSNTNKKQTKSGVFHFNFAQKQSVLESEKPNYKVCNFSFNRFSKMCKNVFAEFFTDFCETLFLTLNYFLNI